MTANKREEGICQDCGGLTENEFGACAGALAEEYGQNVPPGTNTMGLISCNCCESCRIKCHNSYMAEIDERRITRSTPKEET
jgi:hypothetical protein